MNINCHTFRATRITAHLSQHPPSDQLRLESPGGTVFFVGESYEVVLQSTDERVLPSVHVWQDHGNTVILGTLIPAGKWVEINATPPL